MNRPSLAPVLIDRHGPAYDKRDLDRVAVNAIVSEQFFLRHGKKMKSDIEKAVEITEKGIDEFGAALDRFLALEQRYADQSKKASGSVRDASEKLAQGLARIEKAANFDRLERYVQLLERAANAISTLAEIEASGKLEKIAGAIR